MLVPALKAWHQSQGSPASGAAFPARRGGRARQHKVAKQSYAEKLRNALWAAGIVRPTPGYDPEHPDRALCLIQSGSTERRPLDFHSFRRAYNTALAMAGVNVQVSMKLAGHRNPTTHMRYVLLAVTLTTPAAALPQLTGTQKTGDPPPPLPPSTADIAPAEEITADLRTVQAACMPELPPANDTDKNYGINSAPPTGVEPVTFGLGNQPAERIQQKTSLSGDSDLPEAPALSAELHTPGQLLFAKTRARAADAALTAYLRELATGYAEALTLQVSEGGQS